MYFVYSHFINFLVSVYYVTSAGNIKGILTINEDIILFDPFINDYNKKIAHKNKSISL